MKIGYFSSKFPYHKYEGVQAYPYGGSVLATYYLALEIARRGHDVEVFTTSYNSKEYIDKYNNLKIYRYGTNIKLLTSNISLSLFYKPLKHNFDIVHVSFDIPPGPLAGLRYAKKKNIPLIVTYHGDWDGGYGNIIRRLGITFHNKFLVDKLLSYADVIISPSEYYINGSNFLRKYKNKIVVIPNGINLEEFNKPYSKKECREKLDLPIEKDILLFFGFLSPYKGPDILVKAMPRVLKDMPDTELVFAGRGVMLNKLKMLSKSLGIEDNIRFEGFVEDSLKPLYYKASDVFCLPSTMKTECYPLTILEAMACGVPIVATDMGGISEVVKNGENGLLVPPNNPDALADAIIYLLENGDARKKMGRNGREKVKNYLWEQIAEVTENVYEVLIGELK